MNETLRKWYLRVTAMLEKFTPAQKRNITLAAVFSLICAIVIIWFLSRPNYVAVFTGLDDKSLGQVQTELETLKIPNQVQGSSILVPRRDADTARVQLAMAGLPKQGYIGYGSVSSQFGLTQDQFNIQVLDLLQQSLGQTIQSIDGIESAQVHIRMPDQTLFVAQPQDSAQASVFVTVGPGVQLTPAQVAGIQQLVSHSVKQLSPSDVAVVDQNGVALSSQDQLDNQSAQASGELSTRQLVEQRLKSQLTTGLESIVGYGNAVVMVHANMTFNQVQTKSRTYVPQPGQTTGMIANQQKTTQSSKTTGSNAVGGIAGQGSSNPGVSTYGSTSAGGGNSTTANTQTTTNFDNGYTDSTTVADPIQLNGFTVGVFLNSADKALTPAVIKQIKSFVANAVGTTTNGSATNNISVVTVPFQTQQTPTTLPTPSIPMWGAAAAGLLLLGGAGYVIAKRRRRRALDQDLHDVAIIRNFTDELDTTAPSEDEHMKGQLVKLADQRPEEFASLLRTWLVGD